MSRRAPSFIRGLDQCVLTAIGTALFIVLAIGTSQP
jgi:hypothetical protein